MPLRVQTPSEQKQYACCAFVLPGSQYTASDSTVYETTGMPRTHNPWSELGSVDVHNNSFCAHVRYRSEAGVLKHIRGPDRHDHHRAETDLHQMRAAGAVGGTREEGLQIMAAEARRIQTGAEFEEQARAEMQRAAEDQRFVDYLSEEESDDEPCFVTTPPDEEVPEVAPTLSERSPLTRDEADRALQGFRASRASPADLEHILASRADPNRPPSPDNITPLRKVLAYARGEHMEPMRELLLRYGARESQTEIDEWATCQKAWLREQIRLNEARVDPRDYDPCAAAVEKNC